VELLKELAALGSAFGMVVCAATKIKYDQLSTVEAFQRLRWFVNSEHEQAFLGVRRRRAVAILDVNVCFGEAMADGC
jgi:hypothetical protein